MKGLVGATGDGRAHLVGRLGCTAHLPGAPHAGYPLRHSAAPLPLLGASRLRCGSACHRTITAATGRQDQTIAPTSRTSGPQPPAVSLSEGDEATHCRPARRPGRAAIAAAGIDHTVIQHRHRRQHRTKEKPRRRPRLPWRTRQETAVFHQIAPVEHGRPMRDSRRQWGQGTWPHRGWAANQRTADH